MFPKCNPFDKESNRHRTIDMTVYFLDIPRAIQGEGGFCSRRVGRGGESETREVRAIPVRDEFQGARGWSAGVTLNWNQLALRTNQWREEGQTRAGRARDRAAIGGGAS